MRHSLFVILSSVSLLLTIIALYVSGNENEIEATGEILLIFVIVILVALALTQHYWTTSRSVEV